MALTNQKRKMNNETNVKTCSYDQSSTQLQEIRDSWRHFNKTCEWSFAYLFYWSQFFSQTETFYYGKNQQYVRPSAAHFNRFRSRSTYYTDIGTNDTTLNKTNKEVGEDIVKLSESIITKIENIAVSNISLENIITKRKSNKQIKSLTKFGKKRCSLD